MHACDRLLSESDWIEDCLPQVRKADSPEAKVRLTKPAGTAPCDSLPYGSWTAASASGEANWAHLGVIENYVIHHVDTYLGLLFYSIL
jgi:hypothetical protein